MAAVHALPVGLDPLIAEAKRRARRRRLLAIAALLVVAAAVTLTIRELNSSPQALAGERSAGQIFGPRLPVWSVDDRNGVAVISAPSGVWASPTRDRTWRRLRLTGNVAEVTFVDPLQAFAVTVRNGRVEFTRTADGGRTWLMQSSFRATQDATATFLFSTRRSGYLMLASHSGATLFKTADGGRQWSRIARAPFQWGSLGFVRGRGMWAMGAPLTDPGPGEGGDLFRSRDGGRSWQRVALPHEDAVRAFSAFGATLIAAANVGRAGDLGVYVSTDGGAHWRLRTGGERIPMPVAQFPFSAVSPSKWFASALLATSDAGRHWRAVHSDLSGYVWEIDFASPQVGWAITDGKLMRTTDGGRHWLPAGPRKPKGRKHG
jgi:photosystem II stability/assembly factor-like uncharacterized protein